MQLQPYDLQLLSLGQRGGDFIHTTTEFTGSANIQAILVNNACTIEYIHDTNHAAISRTYINTELPAGFYMGFNPNQNLKYFKLSVAGSLSLYY